MITEIHAKPVTLAANNQNKQIAHDSTTTGLENRSANGQQILTNSGNRKHLEEVNEGPLKKKLASNTNNLKSSTMANSKLTGAVNSKDNKKKRALKRL